MSQSPKGRKLLVDELILFSFNIFRFLGWNPFDEHPSWREKLYWFIATSYAGLCLIKETIYLVLHVGDENAFLSLTNLAPCLGFVILALIKIGTIYGNRSTISKILSKLIILDTTNQLLDDEILRTSWILMRTLKHLFMSLIWIFNLMPIVVIIYCFCLDGSYNRQMPYLMWYPWNCLQPFVYEVCYAAVMWGAFTCSIGILSADLLFCTIINLVCLQFNALKRNINQIIAENSSGKMRKWINTHNELLQTVNDIEGIFSVSLLTDFTGSSFILCMVGFQTVVSCRLNFNCLRNLNFSIVALERRIGFVQVLFVSHLISGANFYNMLARTAVDKVSLLNFFFMLI